MRTRVKICGITNILDAKHAIAESADAIGLVFYEPSPRYVSVTVAQEICSVVPPFVTVVGLFVDASVEFVSSVLEAVPLDLLQFHGVEKEAYCRQFNCSYIKAVRVRSGSDVVDAVSEFTSARGLLVDTYKKGIPGGTGETFDWDLLPKNINVPLVLAGGLNPTNVRNAISTVEPFAVDVSGGVEKSKGVKDLDKIKSFMNEVSRGCAI